MPQSIHFDVNCPHCKKSLMDPYKMLNKLPSIRVDVTSKAGKGTLRLCSVYDCFDHESDLKIEKEEIVQFSCPSCKASLTSKTECDACSAPMVEFRLEMGGRVNICSRKGCTNHSVQFVDLASALDAMYHKFDYGSPQR